MGNGAELTDEVWVGLGKPEPDMDGMQPGSGQ